MEKLADKKSRISWFDESKLNFRLWAIWVLLKIDIRSCQTTKALKGIARFGASFGSGNSIVVKSIVYLIFTFILIWNHIFLAKLQCSVLDLVAWQIFFLYILTYQFLLFMYKFGWLLRSNLLELAGKCVSNYPGKSIIASSINKFYYGV